MATLIDSTATPWEALRALAAEGDAERLELYVESLGPSEAFRALLRLNSDEREQVLTTLSPGEAADLMEEIPDQHAADLLEELPIRDAASILNEMESDDQVDLLGNLDGDEANAILAEMAPADAAQARRLLPYADDVAGGLMTTSVLAYAEQDLVGDVVDDMGTHPDERTGVDMYVYVVSALGRLIGVVDLHDLLQSPRDAALGEILTAPAFVSDETPLEELDEFFQRHGFLAVPVVNRRQMLLGTVSRNDVADALAERADMDYLKSQGIIGGDEIRAMPVLVRSRRRLSWLSLNVILNIIAASVIALYEDTLSAVIALAVFLPIVSDMSGCTGNQAVAVSIRELSLGIVKPYEAVRVWVQELRVGVINGLVLGALIGVAAVAWKGNPYLGLVVGGALAANTLVAVSIGGTVPLLLKRIHVDPAVASGPILTTITDMCGFFLVLSIATAALPLLVTS